MHLQITNLVLCLLWFSQPGKSSGYTEFRITYLKKIVLCINAMVMLTLSTHFENRNISTFKVKLNFTLKVYSPTHKINCIKHHFLPNTLLTKITVVHYHYSCSATIKHNYLADISTDRLLSQLCTEIPLI